jgi:F-type H+-transporting ATPase subunit b
MRRLIVILALALAPAVALAQPHDPTHGDTPATTPPGEGGEHAAPTAAGGEGHGHHEVHAPINWYQLHYGKDVMGGPMGDGKLGDTPLGPNDKEESMSPPYLLAVLNFAILVLILAKFGRPAARKMAETRSDQIKTALDEAARLRDAAQAKLDEYGKKLAAADAEIKQMIEGMRADAEEDRKRVIAAAEAQAAALKKEAEERIAAEIDFARHALARDVAVAAATAAETLIKQKITNTDQTKLVDTFISDVGTQAGSAQERS